MDVLITGGLGNLGLWIVEKFLSEDFTVTVLSKSESVKIERKKYNFIKADITDYPSLKSSINKYYDLVIHAASINEHFIEGYDELSLRVNALGTNNILKSLSNYGVGKFIYLSTFHVYGLVSGKVDELTEVKPVNDYGLTHYFAEKYIEMWSRKLNIPYNILRLTNSYGCPKSIATNKWYLIFNDFCYQAINNKSITINGNKNAQRDFIWMGDVCNLIYLFSIDKNSSNKLFNICRSESIRLIDLAEKICLAYEIKYKKNIDIVFKTEGDTIEVLNVSNEKLIRYFDYKFNDCIIEEAINIFDLLDSRG